MHDDLLAALAIVSGISGLALAWLTHRRESTSSVLQATSGLIENFDRVRKALAEENERLARQLEQLRKELLQEKHRRAALEERLDIERELFDRRIRENEQRLKELTILVANNTTINHPGKEVKQHGT